jgi:hypothetical protein
MERNEVLAAYTEQRDRLLAHIASSLAEDGRFVAAWLGGSLGRGDADAVSDLDITVVVADAHAVLLCAQPERATAHPPAERLAFFARFGDIAFVSEHNPNAPPGGTSTGVMYADSGVIVDWVLVPLAVAQRPPATRLLFAHEDIPLSPESAPLDAAERAKAASVTLASFWMMASVTAKYIVRGDGVFVAHWLEGLARFVQEIERQLNGATWSYRRGSLTELAATRDAQVVHLRRLCDLAAALSPRVAALGGHVWPEARAGVERWLRLAEESVGPR